MTHVLSRIGGGEGGLSLYIIDQPTQKCKSGHFFTDGQTRRKMKGGNRFFCNKSIFFDKQTVTNIVCSQSH